MSEDELTPASPPVLDILRAGEVEVLGRMPWSSNATLLVDVRHGGESLHALRDAVARLLAAVEGGDEAGFARMMRRGSEYLAGRNRER